METQSKLSTLSGPSKNIVSEVVTLFQGAATIHCFPRKVLCTSFIQAILADVRWKNLTWLGPNGDCGDQEKGPKADVHQTKWEMRGSKIFAVSVCFFTGEFVLLLCEYFKTRNKQVKD